MKPDAIIVRNGQDVSGERGPSLQHNRSISRWGLRAGALTLAALLGSAVGSGLLGGGEHETSADVHVSLPGCGDQKGGSKELIIVAGRGAPVTVRPDDSKEHYISLGIGSPGQFTVIENPGAEQPPLRPGQDQDVKNFDFGGKLQLSIDPAVWPGPGDRTQLSIARDCPR